jgi:hypothetical protein
MFNLIYEKERKERAREAGWRKRFSKRGNQHVDQDALITIKWDSKWGQLGEERGRPKEKVELRQKRWIM